MQSFMCVEKTRFFARICVFRTERRPHRYLFRFDFLGDESIFNICDCFLVWLFFSACIWSGRRSRCGDFRGRSGLHPSPKVHPPTFTHITTNTDIITSLSFNLTVMSAGAISAEEINALRIPAASTAGTNITYLMAASITGQYHVLKEFLRHPSIDVNIVDEV